MNLDPDVIKYTGDVAFKSIEEAQDFLNSYDHYNKYGFGRWAVIRNLDEEFLGWCGLKYTPELEEYDIGFRFFQKYWGIGYATEAAKACIDWAFQKKDIKVIVGRAMSENIASCKVLEKIGLKYLRTIEIEEGQELIYTIRNEG
jgi:RimJ/RimL family protein N-acetyltransferase